MVANGMGNGSDFDLTRGDPDGPSRGTVRHLPRRNRVECAPVIDDGDDWDTHNAQSLAVPAAPATPPEPSPDPAAAYDLATHTEPPQVAIAPAPDVNVDVDPDAHDDETKNDVVAEPVALLPVDDEPAAYTLRAPTGPTRSYTARRISAVLILALAGLTTIAVILSIQPGGSSATTPRISTGTPLTSHIAAAIQTAGRTSAAEITTLISKAHLTSKTTHRKPPAQRRRHPRTARHTATAATRTKTSPPVAQTPASNYTPPPTSSSTSDTPTAGAVTQTHTPAPTHVTSTPKAGPTNAGALGGIGTCVKGCT